MDFSKLFLGYNETNDFMKLAIREKIITKYADCFDDEPIMSEENHFRIYNKTELLRLMLLFESIDTNHLVLYDVDKLIDAVLRPRFGRDFVRRRQCRRIEPQQRTQEFRHGIAG